MYLYLYFPLSKTYHKLFLKPMHLPAQEGRSALPCPTLQALQKPGYKALLCLARQSSEWTIQCLLIWALCTVHCVKTQQRKGQSECALYLEIPQETNFPFNWSTRMLSNVTRYWFFLVEYCPPRMHKAPFSNLNCSKSANLGEISFLIAIFSW